MKTFWKYLLEASIKDIQSSIEGLAGLILSSISSSAESRIISSYAHYLEIKNDKIQYDYDTLRFLLGTIVYYISKNSSLDNIPLINLKINGRIPRNMTGFECKLNNDLFMNYHYDYRKGYINSNISATPPETPAIKVDSGTAILFHSDTAIANGIMMEITKEKFNEFKEYHDKIQQSTSRSYMAPNQPKNSFFPLEIDGKYYIIMDLVGLSHVHLNLDLKNSDFIKYLKKLDFHEFYSLQSNSNKYGASHIFAVKSSIERYLSSWGTTAPKEFTTLFKNISEIPDIDEVIGRQIIDKILDNVDIEKYKIDDDYQLSESLIMGIIVDVLTEYYKEMGHL
jgi:hypothetical protein